MDKIKILVVDDHPEILKGIRALLDTVEEFEIVGEAREGQESIEIIKENIPDIVLMDLKMPGMDGLKVTQYIRKLYPSIKVLAITQYEDRDYILKAIKAGVIGYIPKRVLALELVTALRVISNGGTYFHPSITKTIIESYKHHPEADDAEELTLREKEILKLVVAGYTSRKISQTTGIPVKTVQNYRLKISRKLKTKNLASLIRYAINAGLVDIDE